MFPEVPNTRKGLQYCENGSRTQIQLQAIPHHHTFHPGVLHAMLPEKIRRKFPLEGRKAQAIVAIPVEQEFNPPNAERAFGVVKYDEFHDFPYSDQFCAVANDNIPRR